EDTMASDTFQRELLVPADISTTWATWTDVSLLSSWVSVLGDVEIVENLRHYKVVLEDRVGPLKLRAPLDLICDVQQEGHTLELTATGKDSQVNASIAVEALFQLENQGSKTQVMVSGRYRIAGRVASMGGGIIKMKA